MAISGHKAREVFERYNIVDTEGVVEAMRRVQGKGLVPNNENGENQASEAPTEIANCLEYNKLGGRPIGRTPDSGTV